MKKHLKCICSLIFSVIMLQTSVPVYYAEDDLLNVSGYERWTEPELTPNDMLSDYDNAEEIWQEMQTKTNAGVTEIESLREESVKHIQMENGEFRAISYTDPVHRKSSDGSWTDIDNRLIASADEYYRTEDGMFAFGVTSKANIYRINGECFSMALSFPDGNKSSKAEVTNHPERQKTSDDMTSEEKLEILTNINNTTKIVYRDVYSNTDIEYILYANNIKENIVINKKTEKTEYKFVLETDNLDVAAEENGTIGIYKDGEKIYYFPAPYMYDSTGNKSYNLHYVIEKKNNKTEISIIADGEWLDKAQYPVTIDPTVTANTGIDSYVSSMNPNSNYGSNPTMTINGSSGNTCYALIKINMPGLPTYANITSSFMYLAYDSVNPSGSMNVELKKINSTWSSSSVTWNTMPSNVETLPSGEGSFSITSTNTSKLITLTETAKLWAAGAVNYGLRLKYLSGTTQSVNIKSKEYSNSSERPYLSVTYTIVNPVVLNGVYLIKSKDGTNVFASRETSGNNIALGSCQDSNSIWRIQYLHNGYYNITASANSKVISVAPGYETSNYHNLLLETYSASARQFWSITTTNQGNLKMIPKSGENASPQKCMQKNGSVMQQGFYRNNGNLNDEWLLVDVYGNNIDNALLCAHSGMSGYISDTKEMLHNYDGPHKMSIVTTLSPMYCEIDDLTNENQLLPYLRSNKFAIIASHGDSDKIYTYSNDMTKYLRMDDLTDENLSNLAFVFLGCCDCALGYPKYNGSNPVSVTGSPINIAGKFVSCGAKSVLAFNSQVDSTQCDRYTKALINLMISGLSLGEAVSDIEQNQSTYFYPTPIDALLNSVVIVGDPTVTIR